MMKYRKNRRLFMEFVEKWLIDQRHPNLESAEVLKGISKQLHIALPKKAINRKNFKRVKEMRSSHEKNSQLSTNGEDFDTFKLFRNAVIEAAADARLSVELLVDIYEKLKKTESEDVDHCITQLEDRFKQIGIKILNTNDQYDMYKAFTHFWDLHDVSDGPDISVESPAYILAKNDDTDMWIPIKRGTVAKLKNSKQNAKNEKSLLSDVDENIVDQGGITHGDITDNKKISDEEPETEIEHNS